MLNEEWADLQPLKKALENFSNHQGSIITVTGDIGIGKTRFLEEIKTSLQKDNHDFCALFCHPGQKQEPFQAFKEIIRWHISYIFEKKSQEKIKEFKKQLIHNFHTMGQIILQLNPQLEQFIGSFPPIELDDENKDFSRFLEIINEFFIYMSDFTGRIIIIIDDFQWIDWGTFEIILKLSGHIKKQPYLFIFSIGEGPLGDRLFDTGEEYKRFITTFKDNNPAAQRINLVPLNEKETKLLLSHTLGQPVELLKEISSYIYHRTKGNPFFTLELLQYLIRKKGLINNGTQWHLDGPELKKITLPTVLLDFANQLISRLPEFDKKILSGASLLGYIFEKEMLINLLDYEETEITAVIDKAISNRLLVKYKKGFYFSHAWVKSILYKTLAPEERKKLHATVARLYENKGGNSNVYEIAHHYVTGECYEKGKEYLIKAAKIAENNYANDEAIIFCRTVISIEETHKKTGSSTWIQCMVRLGRILMIIGKLDESLAVILKTGPLLKTTADKLTVFRLLSILYLKKGNMDELDRYANLGLKMIGTPLPQGSISVIVSIIKELAVHCVYTLFPGTAKMKSSSRSREEAVNAVWLFCILQSKYAMEGSWKGFSTAIKMANFARKYIGPSKELGMSFAIYGLSLAEIPLFKSAERNHLKALGIREKYNDEWGIAHSSTNLGFLYKIQGELRKCIGYFNKSNDIYLKIGVIGHVASGANTSGLAGAYLFVSEYDNAKIMLEEYLALSYKLKSYWGRVLAGMHYTTLYTETGDFLRAEEKGLKAIELAQQNKNVHLTCISQIALGRAYYEKGDLFNAKMHLNQALEIFIQNPKLMQEYVLPVYPYLADVYILEFKTAHWENKREKQKALTKIKKICLTAFHKTKKWKVNHVLALRSFGCYYALAGNYNEAARLFNKSIDLCELLDRKYELIVTLYEYGMFLNDFGQNSPAEEKFSAAYNLSKEIGAKFHTHRLTRLLGIEDDSNYLIENKKYYQRLTTLLSLSRDISSILNLQELIDLAAAKAIEVSSALRGYIFLVDKKTDNLSTKPDNSVKDGEETVFCYEIVKQVFRTGKSIVKTDLTRETNFSKKELVIKHGLKSVLCLPIQHGNIIEGVCYLDNYLSVGVFSEDDVELMNILMSQVAISIENARNYDEIDELNRSLEKMVAERTKELEQTHRELSLKNHFKSNFLAGMSHEIRTPLNSILGFNQQLLYGTFDSQEDILDINTEIIQQFGPYETIPEVKNILDICKKFNSLFSEEDINYRYYHLLLLKEKYEKLTQRLGTEGPVQSILAPLLEGQEEILAEEMESITNNLQRIHKSGEYLLELVNSILDISRIEAGKINLVIEEVDVPAFMDDIVTTAFSYRNAKNKETQVEILVSRSEEVPQMVLMDSKKIKQVLLNLISNGIKFTPAGEVRLECFLNNEENRICFAIKDTGIGIPEDEIPAIFNEFERTNNAADIEGTGLGLALSKRLVELHQGIIRFESELGRGSTFFVELPLRI